MKKLLLLIMITCVSLTNAQTISGNFSQLQNQKISLSAFDGFDAHIIDSVKTDDAGNFKIKFDLKNEGMGYLSSASGKNFFVISAKENINLQGKTIAQSESIQITEGNQNKAFNTYAKEQPKRVKVLNAWKFLKKTYKQDSLFNEFDQPQQDIQKEIDRLQQEEKRFLAKLPNDSYVKWFLPIRKLVSSVSVVAQYRPEEIPATRKALREINYADDRLHKSGLLKEAIDNHVWFIENSSGSLDQVYQDLNKSIDVMIDQLKEDEVKFNLVTEYLFQLLEERSLFTSAEYLAETLLENDHCGCLNPNIQKQLEKYRKMAEGQTAPDITFTDYTYYPDGVKAKKLSELKADYYLVIFAAGWCPHCKKAIPQIAEFYPEMKAKDIEVVMVSLDENAKDFAEFSAPLPFISTTDFKKWDGQAVQDYQIYATPTYYILDNNLNIHKKLKSVSHLQAWIKNLQK